MKEILEAINFATLAHEGQFRADKITPYISHPLAVALLLQKYGYDKEVIISGILHDIVEDTKYTHDDMIQKFGLEIADIVQGVTEDKNLPYQERKNKQALNLFKYFLLTMCNKPIINTLANSKNKTKLK